MEYTEKAIRLAIGGGYKPEPYRTRQFIRTSRWTYQHMQTSSASMAYSEIFLDPLFWQALGKSLGWAEDDKPYACKGCGTIGVMDSNHMHDCPIKDRKLSWLSYWLSFIRHLAEVKDAESFFKELLNIKQ